jgi:leader peptidase (prepilin peptidase) / N-methyltransferase
MAWYYFVLFFIFGTIVGSFLNVVLYRMRTGRSLNGRSHCMSCNEKLTWYELIPVVSYVALLGRCRHCGASIPLRYLSVEVLTGALCVFLLHYWGMFYVPLIIHTILWLFLIVVIVYDLRHTIIPDELTLGIGGIALLNLSYTTFLSHSYEDALSTLLGGVGGGAFFYILWRVSAGRWIGLGDAKLAVPLGIMGGSSIVLHMIVLSFWVGALISVGMLFLSYCYKKGKTALRFLPRNLTMKSEVPFAPFLILGFFLAYYVHVDIFALTFTFLAFISTPL